MATYKDIAQLTGLSLATISKYFNGLPVRDRNRAAIDAVRNWVFNPGLRDGKPVQGYVLVPISFKLSDI